MGYQYLTTETEEEHGDRVGADETTEETRWCTTCRTQATETCEAHEKKVVVKQQKLICSCGSFTCGAIRRFGLTVPTFGREIQPIPHQYARDIRALDLKAGGAL